MTMDTTANNTARKKQGNVLSQWMDRIYIPKRKLSYLSCRFLAIAVLFGITFGIVLPRYCSDWVYSVYFSGDAQTKEYVKRALDKNTERLYWAQEYFSQLDDEIVEFPKWQKTDPVDLVVVIIAMQRQLDNYNPNYLLQTAAEVHRQFKVDRHFANKRLYICNVNNEPKETDTGEIGDRIKVISRFGGDFPEEEFSTDTWEKSKQDYAFCMSQAMDYAPEYVLVLEDDVILKPDFFMSVHTQLYTNVPIVEDSPMSQVNEANWAYIKLYYPQKWAGYSNDFRHFAELAGIALTGGSMFVLFHYVLLHTVGKQRYLYQRYYTYAWFLTGAIYFLCLAITIGRPYIVDFVFGFSHHSRLVPAMECCTQAVLYPGDVIPHITRHLYIVTSTMDMSHDLIMDRWVDDNGFVRYLVEPNLVHHIGLVSSVRVWAKKAAYFIY